MKSRQAREEADGRLKLTPWEFFIHAAGMLAIIVIACKIYGDMGAPQ